MTAVAIILSNTSPIKPIAAVDITAVDDFCACDFRCNFEELVFANSVSDGVTNDFSDFLFRKISASDTVTIKLFRYDVQVATITDDTLGTFHDGFATQPLYVGWVADWTKIFDAHSGGLYQIKVTSVILGETIEFESRFFRLNQYDAISANGTVKIESIQTGNIVSSEFDFTDLLDGGWRSYIRLKGVFGKMNPTLEKDVWLDSSYRETQNRDVVTREYELRCEIVPDNIFGRIVGNEILGNEIFLTSYNVFNNDGHGQKYIQFPVTAESFDETDYKDYGLMNFSIKFKDRQQDLIKRNY